MANGVWARTQSTSNCLSGILRAKSLKNPIPFRGGSVNEQKVTKIDLLLALMSDGEWHYPSDLVTVSHRFGDTMHRAKEKGYLIETERIKGNACRYRLIGHEDSRFWNEFLKKQSQQGSQLGTGKCPNLQGYRFENISGVPNSNTVTIELRSPSGHQQHLTISSPGILKFVLE